MVRALGEYLLVCLLLGMAAGSGLAVEDAPGSGTPGGIGDKEKDWAESRREILRQLPSPTIRYEDLTATEVRRLQVSHTNYQNVVREKLEKPWFALLVTTGEEPFQIKDSFGAWRELVEFLAEKEALVEVWDCREGVKTLGKRIPAPELARLKRQRYEHPTIITATYPDSETGVPVRYRVEFGFNAAAQVWAANEAYRNHRHLQLSAREVLSARNAKGLPDALAQWDALAVAEQEGHLVALQKPAKPVNPRDLFVALEYEVDGFNNLQKVVRIYRDSEITRQTEGETQLLILQQSGSEDKRKVYAYKRRGMSDELERVPNPLPGRDMVELRVEDPRQPDVRKWNVIEFGEPELLKQTALAHFSLINAYLDKHRKSRALKQANIGLIAEAIIAGLNIGGGVAGVGFPIGAAARLGYDTLIVPRLIPDVPNVKEMRNLLQLLAAKASHPELKTKPAEFLNKNDIKTLRASLAHLSDEEVQSYLQAMPQEDLQAMLQIAKMQRIDAKLVNLLSIISDAGRVSGWTEEAGLPRDLFNNIYVSVTGEISINYILAVLAGNKTVTPLSGVSLYDLSRGDGPAKAWLQYLNFTVDIRAVLNTIERLTHRRLAEKELLKPFPYAPRMSDLSAYEFRIFGFPLLLFYKRGLIEHDLETYQNDYAYGLLGEKIVEYFPRREDLENEIRAGHVVPLGYVRVVSGKGGWKETNLAVFAHRIPFGRHKGKTALVIYGLKAYHEHSALVQRERDRFQELERGLREGAVIEQWLDPPSAVGRPAESLEPVIHAGAGAAETIYEPLLGALLELRRASLLKTWESPLEASEREQIADLRGRLEAKGISVAGDDPLVEVDRFSSSFIYRRKTQDGWQPMKVTLIPGLGDIARDLEKAEEAKTIEAKRRQVASGETAGMVLLNQAVQVDGELQVGPLLTNAQGQVIGYGIKTGEGALEEIFNLIDRLPVTDRTRLQFNRFASTAIEIDADGDGTKEMVFLTIEFPLGEVRRAWTNPVSGERETMVLSDGQLRETVTDRRITELERNEANVETSSRTYENRGSRESPVRGELLEETRTLDFWFRDLSQASLDPYLPLIRRLRINYVTGEITRETHGLFSLPIELVSDRYVTDNRYTRYGLFESAAVYENVANDDDGEVRALEGVLNPVCGRERFRIVSTTPNLSDLTELSAEENHLSFARTDLVLGTVRVETIDLSQSGRKVKESYTDTLDGTGSLSFTSTFEYADDFHHGVIPVRTVSANTSAGEKLAENVTLDYDRSRRRLTAVETDYTGRIRTNTWDSRWVNPIEIDWGPRRISNEYSRDETVVRSTTTLRSNGEILQTSSGEFDATTRTFRITSLNWHRPGIIRGAETNTYSAHGRLISTQVGDAYKIVPRYGTDCKEQARQAFRRDSGTGLFIIPHREEDDYRWKDGARDARIRTWLEGETWDEFRAFSDAEGRLQVDGVHELPTLNLRTVFSYDGASERVAKVLHIQNGEVRTTLRMLAEESRPDGSYVMPVEVIPSWGLAHTNRYLLGDPEGRWIVTEFENGDRGEVSEWFAGAAIPKVSTLLDRHGRAVAQFVRIPNAGQDGDLPYDQIQRYKLSPWGDGGLAEEKAVVRGTDITLFNETAESRVYFDPTKPYESPLLAIDPHGRMGLPLMVGANIRSNVTSVFRSQFINRRDLTDTNSGPEQLMKQERIDLIGMFYHKYSQRLCDRSGAVLQESSGKFENPGGEVYTDGDLFTKSTNALLIRKFVYTYEPGWVVEQSRQSGQESFGFMQTPRSAKAQAWQVNNAGWREWPTEVRGLQTATESGLETEGVKQYVFRRLHSPRILRTNPHLPGVTNLWMSWSRTELREDGSPLFQGYTIFDAQGEVATTLTEHVNSRGDNAWRITYKLPAPSPQSWRNISPESGGGALVNLLGPSDLSTCDFIGFYVDAEPPRRVHLKVKDAAGTEISVSKRVRSNTRQSLSFWPIVGGQVQWLPNEFDPERGSEVLTPGAWTDDNKVFLVSVPDLANAGLQVRQVTTIDLDIQSTPGEPLRISPLFRLEHQGKWLQPERTPVFSHQREVHASGLETLTRTNLISTREESRRHRDWESLLQFGDITVGAVKSSRDAPYFPVVRFIDNADPDSPRPLYSLAVEDGKFLEYYQTIRAGDAQVYTVASGFATPKLEVSRAAVLGDEISPGVLAFGRGYEITIPLTRSSGNQFAGLADLHNRCVASIFTLAGERAIGLVTDAGYRRTEFRRLTQELGDAALQAKTINELPTLAGVLLPARRVPWAPLSPSPSTPPVVAVNTNSLKIDLIHLSILYPETGLIPTAPGTEVERFVDTVREGSIISLALKLDDIRLARELLAFYWEKSQGGIKVLLESYDAKTGAPLGQKAGYKRPSDSIPTAEAQLAIAEAAFNVGAATGDRKAFQFGQNLITLVLTKFRATKEDALLPRGICDHTNKETISRHGVTLWPDARTYSLKNNARAYLLFSRVQDSQDPYPFETEWRQSVESAARDQAAWLTEWIGTHLKRTGVAPKGVFEIQDVHTKSSALAAERWTATDDWLTFLEAANRMGLPPQLTQAWLDNLARVHGVTVGESWGLDWGIALQRPDAISPELTAKFLRVANLLGHRQAAAFAGRNLDQLRQADKWPIAVTRAKVGTRLPTGQGFDVYPAQRSSSGARYAKSVGGWPEDMGVYAEQLVLPSSPRQEPGTLRESIPVKGGDIEEFCWIAAGFYLAILGTGIFWWTLSAFRKRWSSSSPGSGCLIPAGVMQKAEERWAKRVLGLQLAPWAGRSRYSNAATEQNFHMQLRAIYKLVLEWRRVTHNWEENDARLVEDGEDAWLNGMDEFAVMVGIYSRWVVKAGRKDGNSKRDVLDENEDSNHIWSRLVMYFSEWHVALLGLLNKFKTDPQLGPVEGTNDQIEILLRSMGVRPRQKPFDARLGFDVPAQDSAFDLLLVQRPGVKLGEILEEMERKLGISREHMVNFIKSYKAFKRRELPYPIHPYLIEMARLLPHFLLMGLLAQVWFNAEVGGFDTIATLKSLASRTALEWKSIVWAAPLFAGFAFSAVAYFVEGYRFRWTSPSAARRRMLLDRTLTSIFKRDAQVVKAGIHTEPWWNPANYRHAGWALRVIGLVLLVASLLEMEAPNFTTFIFVKGVIGVVFLLEAGGILVPLVISWLSMWLEDRTTANPSAGALIRFCNQLNLVATRPVSLIWTSFRYHFQPSVPTGGVMAMIHAIVVYVVFAATFFFVGGYVHKEALELWFQETYRNGLDLRLVAGAFVFWNTIYLLRFGLFVLFTAISSAMARYPLRTLGGLAALTCLGLQLLDQRFMSFLNTQPLLTGSVVTLGLALMILEAEVLAWLRTLAPFRYAAARRQTNERRALDELRTDPGRALGIVYMSGDDLSFHKLTPELLITRLRTLRDQLNSGGLKLLTRMEALPEEATLSEMLGRLYALEKNHDVTLWHPMQIVVAGQKPSIRPELGLNLVTPDNSSRDKLLAAWHIRRWLVTMMSTAGHAQDTGINLVDIALRLAEERLGGNTVFYLIQNKYDNSDQNRPSQLPYNQGELGQRDKLARLLMEVAPGSRAYSINDWTPFGFKAGGLVGMDLVHEEALKLTNMLIMDRNANAHDLDSVVADLKLALSDPSVVIVIPGRSTTNTLTPIGQSSQLVEEGQRAWTRGVMMLGGASAEALGTGWGNIQAVHYGRVQRGLCDPDTPMMPLTTLGRRRATFGERFEGMIGFGPHAVGISEDIWGVTQAAHNALALGYQVRFRRSKTLWHKMRESWSHAEWFSAFPRWSGGYLQMMLDPIMQRINDDGPLSVFAKELRANGGRFYLGAPMALLGILLMPLAILWDASPFVQVLILLWNVGLVMNQVLTALGLVSCVESKGFGRLNAVVGIAVAGLVAITVEGLTPFVAGLLVLGCVIGGFVTGIAPWLYHRGRDVILFGPQLVIHALGQVVRQSLEFVLSGASSSDAKGVNMAFRAWAGPREDRPAEGYANLVNLRSVVWGVGLGSMCLNLLALTQLDFFNVLLLLPSLLFSVSTLLGPFVMAPKPGRHLGKYTWAPKLLGWATSFCFYCVLAWLVAQGGWKMWFGVLLAGACFGRVSAAGLRYVAYPWRLRTLAARLTALIARGGEEESKAREMASHILRGLNGDVVKSKAFMEKARITPQARIAVEELIKEKLDPLLRQPLIDLQKGLTTTTRFGCEFKRSFVLGLFTFIWFFIVPIPGLLVLTAPGGYRATVPLTNLLVFTVSLVMVVLTGCVISSLSEWIQAYGWFGGGLLAKIQAQYRRFQTAARSPGKLTPLELASLYALFTDVQTHVDQRGYGYARQTLGLIRQKLDGLSGRKEQGPGILESGHTRWAG